LDYRSLSPIRDLRSLDEGHKAIALVAQRCLMPSVRQRIATMLASDIDNALTPHASGNQPLSRSEPQHLHSDYVTAAEKDIHLQFSRAGVRLAFLLNRDLGPEDIDWETCLSATDKAQ
jgi:hypothetical protein